MPREYVVLYARKTPFCITGNNGFSTLTYVYPKVSTRTAPLLFRRNCIFEKIKWRLSFRSHLRSALHLASEFHLGPFSLVASASASLANNQREFKLAPRRVGSLESFQECLERTGGFSIAGLFLCINGRDCVKQICSHYR